MALMLPIPKRSAVLLLAIGAGVAFVGPLPATADPNPFAELAGAWKGAGTLSPLGGKPEKVACRAQYNVSGTKINQDITCAGTDYRINAVSDLTYSDGKFTGSWIEKNYGTGGGAYGSVKGGTIYVRISGDKFNGRMSITYSGARQNVEITQFDAGTGKYTPVINLELKR